MATRADITLKPGVGITSEQARDIRAHAWAFIFRCHELKKAARPGSPDDGEESKNVSTAEPEYNR